MSLLELEGVGKSFRRGSRRVTALQDVSMRVEAREMVVLLGPRRSGRSTLLRIAAGLETPDAGSVHFEGRDPARCRDLLGREISFCHTSFPPAEGERVLDHVAAPLLAQNHHLAEARRIARDALEKVSIGDLATLYPDALDGVERTRVALARALAPQPGMLIVDDPTAQAGIMQRDPILRLLRSLPDGGGPAVLMSTDDPLCVSGADQVLLLEDGRLRSEIEGEKAEVVPLNVRRSAGEAGAELG